MPEIIDFPANLKIGDRTDPQLTFNTRSGGQGIDGTEQILSPLSAMWRYRMIVPIRTKDQVRSLRVVKSRLKGRFNYLRVNMCDQFRITRRDIGAWSGSDPVPYSDDAYFSDDSGFGLAQPKAPVTADALAGAEFLRVRASDFAGAMTAGVFFSVNYWLYQVDNWELDGTDYVLQISPPLREAVPLDAEADFAAPCLWRLESDTEAELNLAGGRRGSVQLNLVEPVGRD